MNLRGEAALRMMGITKHFPGVIANDDITFDVKAGEIRGLLGENGAGKTTLMNILYGLLQPDHGKIYIGDRQVDITSPSVAVDLGIGMVHQHFMLVENLTALENVILGMPSKRPLRLGLESSRTRFMQLSKEYQLFIEPTTPVWQLPVGDQQWLEILKQLYRDAKLLVLDEPTGVLAPSQAEQLFITMRSLADEGRSVIFISHKLEEVLEVNDRITVLRDGRVVGTINTSEATPAILAQMMVGRTVSLHRKSRPPTTEKQAVLVIEDLCCQDDRGMQALKNLNLQVNVGEIVGVAGVDGNGQRELAECIAGLRQPTSGEIWIKDESTSGVIRDSSLLGYIPEDRRKTGLIIDFSIEENLILKVFDSAPFTQKGILRWDRIRGEANSRISQYDIRTPHPSFPVKNLSGGNQQRVVVARELSREPSLLVAAHPTRGLDLGAVEGVHNVLLRERNRGAAVLFISAELSEVMAVSDRIIVMFDGEIMGDLDAETADVNRIGELMLGHHGRSTSNRDAL